MISDYSAVELIRSYVADELTALNLCDVRLEFDIRMKCGTGYICTMADDVPIHLHNADRIVLGISDCSHERLDLSRVFRLFKSAAHELRHIRQEVLMSFSSADDAYWMSLATVCRIAYPDYYRDYHNYVLNIRELDADICGLYIAYELFSTIWGVEEADRQYTSYVVNMQHKYAGAHPVFSMPFCSTDIYRAVSFFETQKGTIVSGFRSCPFPDDPLYDPIRSACDGIRQDEALVRLFFNSDRDARDGFLACTPSLFRLFPHK